jgi:hypothetical protein
MTNQPHTTINSLREEVVKHFERKINSFSVPSDPPITYNPEHFEYTGPSNILLRADPLYGTSLNFYFNDDGYFVTIIALIVPTHYTPTNSPVELRAAAYIGDDDSEFQNIPID